MERGLGVGVNQAAHKAALEAQLRRDGGNLPPMPDGPSLDYFNAHELAQAIESEVTRARGQSLTKLRLDMDHDNAMKLAAYLRRAVLMGV